MSSRLTDEQRLAATTLDRAVTLVAGAGSGKTTVLVRRYLELLRAGKKPREILTVTFTTDAANQLKERILLEMRREEVFSDLLFQSVESTPNIGTLHSFCYGILDQYGTAAGYRPVEKIVTPFEMALAFHSHYRKWLDELPIETLRQLLAYFQHNEIKGLVRTLYEQRYVYREALKKVTCDSEGKEIQDLLEAAVTPFLSQLEGNLFSKGIYTFDDLENLALKVLQVPEVRERLQKELRNLLVDEFQDTSRLQWEILQTLIGDEPHKLFLVGDPKQSIYSFRHAEVKLFFAVSKEIEANGGDILYLSQNFRSDPTLLRAINQLSEPIFEESEIPFEAMLTGRASEEAGSNPFSVVRYETGDVKGEFYRQEIPYVMNRVKSLLAGGAKPEEIALLFRVSDRLSDYFGALQSHGIPAKGKRSTGLFQVYDVLDLTSFLRALENPLNDFALAAFLRSSFAGFSLNDLWQATQGTGLSLFEKLLNQGTGKLNWFFSLVESGTLEVFPALEALFKAVPRWPNQTDAILEFLGPLSEPGLTVPDAVERLEAWEQADIHYQTTVGAAQTGVQLMTVHGAKGLEFPHVLLVDLLRQSPRRSPAIKLNPDFEPGLRVRVEGEAVTTETYDKLQELQQKNDLEESKRILYVALTRAEKTLTLFLPEQAALAPKGSWAALLFHGLL